jgi:hypothetical protein
MSTFFYNNDPCTLGSDFRQALYKFFRTGPMREEAEDAVKTLVDEVLGDSATGLLVEFAGKFYVDQIATDDYVSVEDAELASWHIQQMCGYPGVAQALRSGFAFSIVPPVGYDIFKQGAVLQREGNRYHLVHNDNHFGLSDNVTEKGHRSIAICLFGMTDEDQERVERWVSKGPDVPSHLLTHFDKALPGCWD